MSSRNAVLALGWLLAVSAHAQLGDPDVTGKMFARVEGRRIKIAIRLVVSTLPRTHLNGMHVDRAAERSPPLRCVFAGAGVAWKPVVEPRTALYEGVPVHYGTIVLYALGDLGPRQPDEPVPTDLRANVTGQFCSEGVDALCRPLALMLASSGPGDDALFAKFPPAEAFTWNDSGSGSGSGGGAGSGGAGSEDGSANGHADADPIESLLRRLRNGSPEERLAAAAELLRHRGPAEQLVPAWIELASVPDGRESTPLDQRLRVAAMGRLSELGDRAFGAVPTLIGILDDPDRVVRGAAAFALMRIGARAHAAVPALIARLGDSDAEVRRTAAAALGAIGADPEHAVPALIAAFKDTGAYVREEAARALESMRAVATPKLLELLTSADPVDRGNAVDALGGMGAPAVSALIRALDDPDDAVRTRAVFALGNVGPEAEPAVPALIAILRGTNVLRRRGSAIALGRMGEGGVSHAAAVPALIAALKDPDDLVRGEAAWALGSMGARAAPSLPNILAAQNDPNPDVRRKAERAAKQIQDGR